MVLVIGGAFSGRHKFAAKIAGEFSGSVYDVTPADASSFFDEISDSLKDKKFHAQAALSRVVEKISSYPVVVATEMGCGIVPMSDDDRKLRESNGLLNQALANIASNVILMNCGIPQFIKGDKIDTVSFNISSFAVFFRHGQTESNLLKRFAGGISDVPLTALGVEQAKTTKSKLSELFSGYEHSVMEKILNPKRVFVSPMVRAQDTAKILFPNAQIVTIADICEMKMGLFENMTHDELSQGKFADGSCSRENAEIYQKWLDSKGQLQCPSSSEFVGESQEIFAARSAKAFLQILSMLDDGELPVIVAHGGIQKSLCEQFFRKSCGFRLDYWQSDNAMFRFGELK